MNIKAMNIFDGILQTRSLTVIVWKAEEELEKRSHTPEECLTLMAIMATNKLDEIWAICHEQLGRPEQAKVHRDWLNRDMSKPYVSDYKL